MAFSLNPITWIKWSIQSSLDKAVDEYVSASKGKSVVVDGVNLAVTMAEGKCDASKMRTLSRGFRLAGRACDDIADILDPDGEGGLQVTADEFDAVLGDAQAAFGAIVTEDALEELRAKLKAAIAEKLGV